MSIATLASDSAVSLPSRLPSWVPRILARATASVLRQPVRWPFSSGLSQGRHRAYEPTAQPEAPASPVVVQPAQPVQDSQPLAGAAQTDVSTAAALPLNTLGAHSQSIGTARQALSQDVTVRQMVVDVLLVAMWGALIPGLMWLGAAAGF